MLSRFNTKLTRVLVKKNLSSKIRTYEEVRIPVPWGYIAGKWWGPQNQRPILAIHGWQDNCGTFDPLIPYLPSNLAILAIDSPGHGLSSNFPPGMFYHGIDNVIIYRRILQYFNWDKVSLLGHSLGGILNFLYTMLYPETVDLAINFDLLKVLVFENKKMERMVTSFETFLKYEKIMDTDSEPPAYSLELLERMLHEGSRKSIDLENCKYILERNVIPSQREAHKFHITRDLRIKVQPLFGIPQKDAMEAARRIKCPFFVYQAKEGPCVEEKKHAIEVMDVIKNVNKDFYFETVEGTHHVHLNHPERVAKLITPFIEKYYVHDRSKGGLKDEMRIKSKNSINNSYNQVP